jgi:hypothetical protein
MRVDLKGRRKRRIWIEMLVLVAALSATAVFSTVAAGATARVSKGDATAVLEAFGNGGWAVLLHSKTAEGAPALGVFSPATIRPISGSPFDGAHYCALDWHTIVVADIEPGPRQQAVAVIADLDIQFTLDGAPLAVTKTPVKPFLNPAKVNSAEAYYSQFGRVMAPSELAPGSHTLTTVWTNAAGTTVYLTDGITFFVDAPGTGACL